jgi:outer membrane protein TolC
VISKTAPDSNWWTIFDDSVLNNLVSLAYHQNLSLQVIGLRIMEARAQLAIATGRQYPQIQAVIGNFSAVGVSENIADAVGVNRNFLNYQLGFDISWEADLWGKYRQNVRAQKNNLLATVADYDNMLVSLTAEIARTYTTIRTYEVLIEQAQRNAQLQEGGLKLQNHVSETEPLPSLM